MRAPVKPCTTSFVVLSTQTAGADRTADALNARRAEAASMALVSESVHAMRFRRRARPSELRLGVTVAQPLAKKDARHFEKLRTLGGPPPPPE